VEVRVLPFAQNLKSNIMKNLESDKLKWIEYIITESVGNVSKKDDLLAVPQVNELINFFKIDYDELVVLSILIDGGIRQEEQGMDAFLQHFGGSLMGLKNINNALHSLISKGYVVSTTKNRHSKTLVKQSFTAEEIVYEALLSDKPDSLEFQPAKNFNTLLKNIQVIIDRRNDGCFDAETMLKLTDREIVNAKQCKELDWLNGFDDLTITEKTLFLSAAIRHQKDGQQIDLEYFIKMIEDNFAKQKEFRDSIENKTSSLIEHDLLVRDEEAFIFDEFVGLTDKAKDALFLKEKTTPKKNTYTTGTILTPEDIVLEELFYNELEWQQINTIEKILSKEKHQLVVNQLSENGLAKGISILFNGFSGTGKTATAKRIAKITNRPLFCVDVEKVINKWVGDTEKGTKKIFDQYYEFSKECDLTPILFFNEDSIFSKRVDVGHSTDRTHNSMQNILLEQMELFTGISIVTSNHAEKLDKAFERRFLYRVEFEKPTKETQRSLLQNSFQNISIETINKILESYSFTGGQIYNIRKKYIMQCIIEDGDLESLFIRFCQEESKTASINKIGY
jgi:SpoVK/Ycf46/Vps4 family AAA+-type ATPase